VRLVNLHGLHQRVLLVTLHGSPRRVRTRLPARHPLLASSATYAALAPLLRHCLDHPARVRRCESHVSDHYAEYWCLRRGRGAQLRGKGTELWLLHLALYAPSPLTRRCNLQFGVWYRHSVCSSIVGCVSSRLPARHLPLLSPSAYAALDPLLPSNSLHAPGGAMVEMLGHSSNQFSAPHTGPGCLRGPPAHPESISLRDCGSSLPFPLPVPHPEGQ